MRPASCPTTARLSTTLARSADAHLSFRAQRGNLLYWRESRSLVARAPRDDKWGLCVSIPMSSAPFTVEKTSEALPPIPPLQPETLRAIAATGVTRTFPRNTVLINEGDVGEVVVTPLENVDYPLIRFGTGDLSAILPGLSPCGRTNLRIKGWMGRADQTTKVKGMFVHPSQVAAIIARHREIVRGRLVVDNPDGADRMTLHVEVPARQSSRAEAIVASMREVTKLRGEVVFHAPGELPNDGKVIDDARKIG